MVICCCWCGGVDLGSSNLGFSIVGLINSFFGFFIIIGISIEFRLKFNWIGQNTLNVLAAHVLGCEFVKHLGWDSSMLSYSSLVNLMIEIFINITLALGLGYLFSRVNIFKYPIIFGSKKCKLNKKYFLRKDCGV